MTIIIRFGVYCWFEFQVTVFWRQHGVIRDECWQLEGPVDNVSLRWGGRHLCDLIPRVNYYDLTKLPQM